MSFFDRYAELCKAHNYDPCGRTIAEAIGFNNASATYWRNNKIPKGETVRAIADFFHVSTDYLLERTEDPAELNQATQELTAKERELLKMFRTLNPQQQDTILTMIEPLYEQAKKIPVESA